MDVRGAGPEEQTPGRLEASRDLRHGTAPGAGRTRAGSIVATSGWPDNDIASLSSSNAAGASFTEQQRIDIIRLFNELLNTCKARQDQAYRLNSGTSAGNDSVRISQLAIEL